jgi:hypothetical protein
VIKTAEGKWVVFDQATGRQLERWPVDAKLLVESGAYTLDPPEGVDPVLPKAPPRHVGIPTAPVAKMFVAPEEEDTAPAKRGRAAKGSEQSG